MFISVRVAGLPDAPFSLLGAILPPTGSMLMVMLVLQNFQNRPDVRVFMQGMVLATAMLMAVPVGRASACFRS